MRLFSAVLRLKFLLGGVDGRRRIRVGVGVASVVLVSGSEAVVVAASGVG